MENPLFLDMVNPDTAGTMNNLVILQENACVNDLAGLVGKKCHVTRTRICKGFYFFSLSGLLDRFAVKAVPANSKDHLNQSGGINSKWTFPSPLIGGIEVSPDHGFHEFEVAPLTQTLRFPIECKLFFDLEKFRSRDRYYASHHNGQRALLVQNGGGNIQCDLEVNLIDLLEVFWRDGMMLARVNPALTLVRDDPDGGPSPIGRTIEHLVMITKQQLRYLLSFVIRRYPYRHNCKAANSVVDYFVIQNLHAFKIQKFNIQYSYRPTHLLLLSTSSYNPIHPRYPSLMRLNSRLMSLSLMPSRLSCVFLPLAREISSLA